MPDMTVIASQSAATKRPSYATAAISCYQCGMELAAPASELMLLTEAHVNRWHPVIVGPRVNLKARNVTPFDALGSGGTGTAPS